MGSPRRIGRCRICQREAPIYRAGACRPCDARLHRDAHKPAGKVEPVGARPGALVAPVLCECGRAAHPLEGLCFRCWGLTHRAYPIYEATL